MIYLIFETKKNQKKQRQRQAIYGYAHERERSHEKISSSEYFKVKFMKFFFQIEDKVANLGRGDIICRA